ncbi:MAG: hypothetical protein A2W52_02015 [Candidatus Taylorbacteria bacterium RIFCSPHIGHO2_02_49_25]|uniref:Uncharacterized protein n=1 Tax=Candidatus Taylorbacteria bacterium RIFCSPHIGHO2_02_49_25 TaxID=1802305 RepID=A0A1G2MI07_9BACT|nr:MAG: hypothetical protein UY62_C0081G0013 [Parcubacteria group bacterium GW2011_GWF2_50_9]OGG67013.1 MAG: hypothetical protein A2Z56_03370 [Candidatus Kaiserbacteria bacterium RIFCSPHIGHO2_12_45_16]OHA19790.1 MAG: hypothetical protein A2759_01010 [Candidatus Taylorbacteria bacterium RIFCSPHIGHO2_01_FULL_49_60]OHA23483.1 MAG: hypothetical protein A2W52_02015 [Candidatus Taylorbacteria bacterium RIFCSPHIGHO2_02_49_25]OHA36836.1 MAG: hypothetical protein A2W65_00005 [Candidatus Taylorbacteria b
MGSHKNKNGRSSAILSYVLSGLYLLLNWLFPGAVAPLVFIGIHSAIIAIAAVVFLWIYLSIGIGFASGKMAESDKSKVKLILKTFPAVIFLSLLYWVLPIGLYVYSLYEYKFLYPFVWLPLWFPILYYLIERKIKAAEKRINSPVATFDND